MKKKSKKEKKPINPEIVERDTSDMNTDELRLIAESIEKSTIIPKDKDKDNFFQAIVKSMNDVKNISMKTEYLGVKENYTGTKLDYLATMGNMPYLKKFVQTFETKRVSLGRKGRKEDVMILQEREREIAKENQKDFSKLFNIS